MARALFWLVALLLAVLALRVWLGPAPTPFERAPVTTGSQRDEPDAGAPPLDDIDDASREALRELLRDAGREDEATEREQ